MSLDIHLDYGEIARECTCSRCGHKHSFTTPEYSFSQNITHNLNTMAMAAGIYHHVWRPEEIGITKASQLIEPLREGIRKMRGDPEYYEKYNSPNSWGLYENFLPWLEKYLAACEEYPEADVSVSR